MRLSIQKWGNSLALRLPRTLTKELGLGPGTPVDVHLEADGIIIKRVPVSYVLEDMVSEIREENKHGEIEFGRKGREVW